MKLDSTDRPNCVCMSLEEIQVLRGSYMEMEVCSGVSWGPGCRMGDQKQQSSCGVTDVTLSRMQCFHGCIHESKFKEWRTLNMCGLLDSNITSPPQKKTIFKNKKVRAG